MDNTTALTFTMTAYTAMVNYKNGLFTVFLLLYCIIIILNSLLITVIYQNKALHQPMNLFACMLSMNEMYGSTSLFPAIMFVLMSETHEIVVKWCMAQVYFLHTYASAEFTILAVMGYDRYVAICFPLHYYSIMSHSKIGKLVAFAALYPLIVFGCFYSLTLQLSFCGKVMPKLYCVNMQLVANGCSNSSKLYISTVGLAILPLFIVPQVVMIALSYVRISRVCMNLSRESQRNALKTCVPHVFSLLNYTTGVFLDILQTRFDMTYVSIETQIFLSLYYIIIPAIANPVLYGLGTQRVRVHILNLLVRYKILPTKLVKAVIVA